VNAPASTCGSNPYLRIVASYPARRAAPASAAAAVDVPDVAVAELDEVFDRECRAEPIVVVDRDRASNASAG
jgi:hypothetical protein